MMICTLMQNTVRHNLAERKNEGYKTEKELAKAADVGRATITKAAAVEAKAAPEDSKAVSER